MKALAGLDEETACGLKGVIFDLDGTVLSDGSLTLEAYRAIHRLAEQGLRLIACTGRPAGWGAVVQRQWPVDMAVAENGAVAFHWRDDGLMQIDRCSVEERQRRRDCLAVVADELRARFDDLLPANDNLGRLSDITFDIGETQQMAPDRLAEIIAVAEASGVRTFASSIHLHITLESDDKASGTLYALNEVFGEDEVTARRDYAFIGDSGNDAAAFNNFVTTFGVANIRPYLQQLTRRPRFMSDLAQGQGFAEIVERLLALRERR